KEKLMGEDRRTQILSWLKESDEPLTGTEIAEQTNVSRQVIVQDVSLLKARGEPIIATSRGYIFFEEPKQKQSVQRIIAVDHPPEETKEELYILVDHGIFVKNVMVDHPIYGDLEGSLMIQSRRDVDKFLQELQRKNASLLLR